MQESGDSDDAAQDDDSPNDDVDRMGVTAGDEDDDEDMEADEDPGGLFAFFDGFTACYYCLLLLLHFRKSAVVCLRWYTVLQYTWVCSTVQYKSVRVGIVAVRFSSHSKCTITDKP